jgi:serine/threonine protein kinase
MLGKGVYSQVFYGKLGNQEFAVKKFRSEKKYKLSTSREILINEMLMNSEDRPVNIIKSFGSFFDKTYFLVFELQNLNLFNFIKFYKEDFDSELVLKIGKQITTGLSFLHKDFIHCDLKPENIVVDTNTLTFKIIDFGLSYFITEPNKNFNIQSYYYRAPEVCLHANISPAIDIWSLGCILYECASTKVLFHINNNKEIFYLIAQQVGDMKSIYGEFTKYKDFMTPDIESFAAHTRNKYKIDNVYKLSKTLGKEIYNKNIIEIIETCLNPDFKTRIKSKDLLEIFKNIM